jgi:uncharacterized protein (DUF488 family)
MNTLWTVGHSNRSIDDFLALLAGESIELVADVRRFPGSRKWPQYGRDALAASLAERGIAYEHFEALGGRRRQVAGSPNQAWRVAAFNAYADHMATSEFHQALMQLQTLAGERRTAILCAEALPWRCHRRLIADALLAHGWQVFDILSARQTKPHALTEFARIANGGVTYPAAPTLFD